MNGTPAWSLQDFLPRLDAWVSRENPTDELRVHVTRWIFTRMQDPMSYARRAAGFEDLWQAVVPDSEHFDDHLQRCAVICLYWIDVPNRVARCDGFASLSLPIDP